MRRRLLCVAFVGALLAAGCSGGSSSSGPTREVNFNEEPIAIVDNQFVAVDLDGDGVETVILDGSRSIDPTEGGSIVDYRFSDGLDEIGSTAVHEQEFEVGQHVVTLTVTDNEGLSDIRSVVVRVLVPYDKTESSPDIVLWRGNSLSAREGAGQQFVNVAGNISDDDVPLDLQWSLNGLPEEPVDIGPTLTGLVNVGDFSIDIPVVDLKEGLNTVELIGRDQRGEVTRALVRVENEVVDPDVLPVTVDWSTLGLEDLEVVDGNWSTDGDEVVIEGDAAGFSRALALGDRSFDDYDVTTSFTVDELPSEIVEGSGFSSLGIAMRWTGRFDEDAEFEIPNYAVYPQFVFRPGGTNTFVMEDHLGDAVDETESVTVGLGVPHFLRVQSQTTDSGSVYRAKLWQADAAEPDWQIFHLADGADFEPANGAFLLIANEMSARFGETTIEAVDAADRLSDGEIDALFFSEPLSDSGDALGG